MTSVKDTPFASSPTNDVNSSGETPPSTPPGQAASSRRSRGPAPESGAPSARASTASYCEPFTAGEPPAPSEPEALPNLRVQTHTRFHDDGSNSVRRSYVVATRDEVSGGEPMGDAATRALRNKHLVIGGKRKAGSDEYPLAASDAHMHPTGYRQQGRTLGPEFIANMDEIAMARTTLMPIPTTVIGTAGDVAVGDHAGCGPAYYIPPELVNIDFHDMTRQVMQTITRSDVEIQLDTGVDASLANQLKLRSTLTQADRERFDPMITGLNLGDINAAKHLLVKLYENKGTFTGVGEITLAKELIDQLYAGRSQANVHTNIEAFIHLAEIAGVVGMPIVMHCDVDSLAHQLNHRGEPHVGDAPCEPANLDALKQLIGHHKLKSTTLVWAHAGGLGRFIAESGEHVPELEKILDANKNLMIDISWSRVATQLTQTPFAAQRWANFLATHHTRVLFGSDVLSPTGAAMWNETRALYTDLLNRLPIDKQADILNNNYERVFVASRPKVRNFENKVLTEGFHDNVLRRETNQRLDPEALRTLLAA